VSANGQLTPAQHAKSLLFGLGLAAFVGLLVTFTFFNEVFIAPFISPSRNVSATPIIGSATGDVGPDPKIIIPKINLEVPVVFGMDTIVEEEVQKALEDGVVHYATTPNPGETGNVAIVGHSSNNILNSGKYKFAFVLLKRLENDDVFFVHKDGIRYTYKVYKKEIVTPDNVSVLQPQEKPNTVTLITCDPPGTSVNRLIIVAEQISPDPAGNKPSTAIAAEAASEELPSNAPSLWSRLWPF
jgi:sortase A